MPTLLGLVGAPVPATVTGVSMAGPERRSHLYGDCLENNGATRMLHDGRHKLIWYPAGNVLLLFDLETAPMELRNLADDPAHADIRDGLVRTLCGSLWGIDLESGWATSDRLIGYDPGPYVARPDRSWSGQRGLHYPVPPSVAPDRMVGFPQ